MSYLPEEAAQLCRGAFLALLSTWTSLATAEQPRFVNITQDQGLSDSTVLAIAEDPRGFMWFGTEDGLNRYDGYECVVYRYDDENSRSLSQNLVAALLVDREGILWVGTSGGLNRYDPDSDSFIRYETISPDSTGRSSPAVHSLYEDRSGDLWIGGDNGLSRFDRQTGNFERFSHPGAQRVNAILEDREGRLWIGGDGSGLDLFDPQSGAFEHRSRAPDIEGGSDRDVYALYEDSDGYVWVASHGGLDRYDVQSDSFIRFRRDSDDPQSLGSNHVDAILETRQGLLWIGTDGGGLDLLDRKTLTFSHVRHQAYDPAGLPSDVVRTIYEDSKGDIWVGTFKGGIAYFNASHAVFTNYRHRPGDVNSLVNDEVWSFFEEDDGRLWIGTQDGLSLFDPRNKSFRNWRHDPNDPDSLSAKAVLTVFRDSKSRLWAGTYFGGLNRLTSELGAGRATFVHYQPDPDDSGSLSNPHVWDVLEDSTGQLWVATFGGLNRFDDELETFEHYVHDPDDATSLAGNLVWQVYEDSGGTLWLATVGGVSAYDREWDHFRSYARGTNVLTVLEGRGVLWLGTDGRGLQRLDPTSGALTVFNTDDGLASDLVNGILEDDEGILWLSTYGGLSKFDPANRTVSNYSRSDGILSLPLNKGSYLETHGGEILLGGHRGFTRFDPAAVRDNPHIPPVVLTDFQIFNKEVAFGGPEAVLERHITEAEEIRLRYDQSVITFTFAALDFRAPEQNRYAYRLEPFDDEWQHVGAKRTATYTNLDPGDYVFRVKASNNSGLWNDRGTAIRLMVSPPVWMTWWAYTLYGLAFAAVVLAYGRSHRKELRREREAADRERAVNAQLREIDKLKDGFLADTSHELRTPLYGITGLAESLIDGATGELPEETKAHLAMIAGSGRRLGQLVNDILDYSRLTHKSLKLRRRPVDLRSLAEVVLTLQKPLSSSKNLELRNTVPADLPAVDADEARLEQILHNLVGNAVKFTEEGHVEITTTAKEGRHPSRAEPGKIVVVVEDTGIGIAADQREQIFEAFKQADAGIQRAFGGTGLGLTVTRELVELHGGRIWVDSAVGQGTRFSFTLPVSDQPAEPEPAAAQQVSRLLAVELPVTRPNAGAAAGDTPRSGGPAGFRPRGARILVVDDDPINLQVLSNHLASEGYEVALAASGPEALALAAERPFDLVILDVMMPRMSGHEVCRALRQRYSLEDLPVIFLTARSQLSDLVAGMAAGGNDYLAKPIGKEELLARVRTHLELLSVHRRLATKNEELARFNYTVAHDLRNPLTTIMNFLGLARRDAASGRTERLEDDFDRLDAAAGNLRRQLDNLFELSRVGLQVHSPEEVAFNELVREALAELAGPIAEREVEVVVAAGLPAVTGDRARLQEALRHLLSNAARYLGDQASPRIEVGVRAAHPLNGGPPIFYVRDNGIGIDPRYQEKIFGLFERLDPEASEGTGIGLALVRRIVEVHGGHIWVESDGRDQGSTFFFTLPGCAQTTSRAGGHKANPGVQR